MTRFVYVQDKYVDHIFCTRTGADNESKHHNFQFPEISFISEIKSNNQLNFLYLTIIEPPNELQFIIHRKTTGITIWVSFDSYESSKVNLSQFNQQTAYNSCI